MVTFEELGIKKKLLDAIKDNGWTEPTPIQIQAIPAGMDGNDLFGQAQTGTGKTGTYALIALGRTKSGGKTPTTLIVAPTRELADQVSKEIKSLAKYTMHSIAAIYGGSSYGEQIKKLESGCDVVVGTPGRILDLHEKELLDLGTVKELVLDEADRMFDMGFRDDIRKIISLTPNTRQTLMFSATVSDDIYDIAEKSMRDPMEISVSEDEIVPELVKQYYIQLKRNGKMDVLRDIMLNGSPKMLIFCATKTMVDSLYEGLSAEGLKIGAIHGDMPQERREKTIRAFKGNRMGILVATDVAARGIDIDDIEVVVNYDSPLDPETYAHRIGRAGRAGHTGTSITFITEREDRRIPSYEEFMGKSVERVSRRQLQNLDISNPELRELHPVEEIREQPVRSHKTKVKATITKDRAVKDIDMTVISVDIGKTAGTNRTELVSYVTACSGISDEEVGRIGLSANSSFVEVASSRVDDVIRAINMTKLNGKKIRASVAPAKQRCKDKVPKKSE